MEEVEDKSALSGMVAERGVKTSRDFVDFMTALMADVIAGRVDAKTANAACVAGGHVLKMVKMQLDFTGSSGDSVPLDGNVKRLGGER